MATRLPLPPDPTTAGDDPAAELLRLGCLTYGADDPSRRDRAAALLAGDPGLAAATVWTAAATCSVDALRDHLAADPEGARAEGGPFGWVPLLYLAYARLSPAPAAARVLACVDLLLAAGADPDAGFLWHGSTPPFTALTGALGGGEGDQPPHPAGPALARRLLAAGADPNDGQALYNRMFSASDEHLELLLEGGLGTGDGGPWRRRLGGPPPAELLRTQLRWAVDHALVDRVRLLARHGVDVAEPFTEATWGEGVASGLTPVGLAARHGDDAMVAALLALRAPPVELGPVEALVAAVLRGSPEEARAAIDADPAVRAAAHAARPALVVQAAASGRPAALRLAVELGFDVDARGRSDTPSDEPWETGLHAAVSHGRADIVRLLLELGADPGVRDRRFGATARGWAEHLGRPELAVLLPPDPD